MKLSRLFRGPKPTPEFSSSASYWEERYAEGGDSGSGSYGRLAKFKADTLNRFVKEHSVNRVIELGCGDGNQLRLALYPSYVGLDVSPSAISRCRHLFRGDKSKSFVQFEHDSLHSYGDELRSDLSASLDVLFHLVEDAIFENYMKALFNLSKRYVVIYSSDREEIPDGHVRHRCFTDWVNANEPSFHLVQRVDNPFPWDPLDPHQTSFSNFYFFEQSAESSLS